MKDYQSCGEVLAQYLRTLASKVVDIDDKELIENKIKELEKVVKSNGK